MTTATAQTTTKTRKQRTSKTAAPATPAKAKPHNAPQDQRITDEQANQYVIPNTRLVHYMLKKFKLPPTNPLYDDIAQDGMMTLMRCARMFDPARGFKFSTYASNSIYRTIKRSLDIAHKHGLIGNSEDIKSDVFNDADFSSFADGEAESDEFASVNEFDQIVRDSIGRLEPRLAGIIRQRFLEMMTLEEISAELLITKERVRQLQVKAMQKLRDMTAMARLSESRL